MDVFFIRVEEITSSDVVVWLYQVFWFKTYESHSWRLQVLNLIHILFGDFDLLTSERVVGAHYSVKENFSSGVQLLSDPLQRFVSLRVDFLSDWTLGFVVKRIYLYSDLHILLLAFLVSLFTNLKSQSIQSSFLELF